MINTYKIFSPQNTLKTIPEISHIYTNKKPTILGRHFLVGVGGNLTPTIGRNEMVSDTPVFERKQALLMLIPPKFNQFLPEMPNTCTALL